MGRARWRDGISAAPLGCFRTRWCRYVPHLVQMATNALYLPLGFLFKGRVIRALFKLFFDERADVRDDVRLGVRADPPEYRAVALAGRRCWLRPCGWSTAGRRRWRPRAMIYLHDAQRIAFILH